MKSDNCFKALQRVILYQIDKMIHNKIYLLCTIVFPLFVIVFFTSVMQKGLPSKLPIAVVDQDNSATTRKLARTLNTIQEVEVVNHYATPLEARKAMQEGTIYGYFYFPPKTTQSLVAAKQPKVSFYYNSSYYLAGSFSFKAMRTMSVLANASVGSAKLTALGYTQKQIKAVLQPIVIDTHIINNPTMDYSVYLNTTFIPACIGIFILLLTVFSLGKEIKDRTTKRWYRLAGDNFRIALLGKMIPQTILFCGIAIIYTTVLYAYLDFPYACNTFTLYANAILFVLASQGLGLFFFFLFPTLRMSMSMCSLWAMLSFSISGFTFPIEAMDAPFQAFAWLFPVRHHFSIYQMVVLNGYPIHYAWSHYLALIIFTLLPISILPKLKNILLTYKYIA